PEREETRGTDSLRRIRRERGAAAFANADCVHKVSAFSCVTRYRRKFGERLQGTTRSEQQGSGAGRKCRRIPPSKSPSDWRWQLGRGSSHFRYDTASIGDLVGGASPSLRPIPWCFTNR